ncbi:MAG: hypothetical protein FJX52_11390 [Alphaproteobacteria bacterium]|nr:hypothetical protein [Alphaproteobacteria bacterium]
MRPAAAEAAAGRVARVHMTLLFCGAAARHVPAFRWTPLKGWAARSRSRIDAASPPYGMAAAC